jgi:hypothetical protein
MEEKQIQDDLLSIRNMMERSTKFISLSGLSGVLAGIYALVGAAWAYTIIYGSSGFSGPREYVTADIPTRPEKLVLLVCIAAGILVVSVLTGLILTASKAKRKGQSIWGKTSKQLLFQMAVPLVAGGLLVLILLTRHYYGITSPAMLIFYGLALIGASNFTFSDVKYLGLTEVLLGLIAACLPGYGLIFWALGFGVLHIVYGTIMYFKYDR